MSETPEKSTPEKVELHAEPHTESQGEPQTKAQPSAKTLAEPVDLVVEAAVGDRPVRSPAQTARAARLATALRDNLRRRKAPRAARTPSGN